MIAKLIKTLEKTLDVLPLAAAGLALCVLAAVFSGTLRAMLLQANLDLLAGAAALLPLTAMLLAGAVGMRGRRGRQQRAERAERAQSQQRQRARLHATYDTYHNDARN